MEPRFTQGYRFAEDGEGGWIIDAEGNRITVKSQAEAELLASLPVKCGKVFGGQTVHIDRNQVRRIIEVCRRYGFHSASQERLACWLAVVGD